jgi:hypothetical protein
MPISYRSDIQRTVDGKRPAPPPIAPRRELTASDFIQRPRVQRVPSRGLPRWTEEEIEELRQLAATSLIASQIAERMGRTAGGIRTRASIEGISLKYSSHRGLSMNEWTKEELDILYGLAASGAKRAEMREALPNRTDGAIGYRVWQMGFRRGR